MFYWILAGLITLMEAFIVNIVSNILGDFLKKRYRSINEPSVKFIAWMLTIIIPVLLLFTVVPTLIEKFVPTVATPKNNSSTIEQNHNEIQTGQEIHAGIISGSNIYQSGGDIIIAPTPLPTSTATPIPEPTLPRMQDGQFNIAVALFQESEDVKIDNTGAESYERSMQIANYINTQKSIIEGIIIQKVEVWGPDTLPSIADNNNIADFTKMVNADVVVFGTISQKSARSWSITPKFYLTENAVRQAEELIGEHALGSSIEYQVNSTASTGDVNTILSIRLKALTQMLVSLSYISLGTPESYEQAIRQLETIASDPSWGRSDIQNGQETLFLFLGNSYLGEAGLLNDEDIRRIDLLEKSKQAYEKAQMFNANYARTYVGLGSVLFQQARPITTKDECDWDWQKLGEAEENFMKAQKSSQSDKPTSGQVDYRTNFGLGRIYFWQGFCSDATLWSDATQHYNEVIQEYKQFVDPLIHTSEIAAYCYSDMATMSLIKAESLDVKGSTTDEVQSNIENAIENYESALDIIRKIDTSAGNTHALEFYPYYITALCLSNSSSRALKMLDEFSAGTENSKETRHYIVSRLDGELWRNCGNDDLPNDK